MSYKQLFRVTMWSVVGVIGLVLVLSSLLGCNNSYKHDNREMRHDEREVNRDAHTVHEINKEFE